jgi:hopanoid-associated phosphorylase
VSFQLLPGPLIAQSWLGPHLDGALVPAWLSHERARDEHPDDASAPVERPLSPFALTVVAIVGLAFEARIAQGLGVLVVGRNSEGELSRVLQIARRNGCRGIVSFGVAGGLARDLRPGDCVVASTVVDSRTSRSTDAAWSRRLLEILPDARYGAVVGANAIVSDPLAKRDLYARTGAIAVDMESHLAARLAAAHGLAFATLRVIVDPAHRQVPRVAQVAMLPGGRTDLVSVLREVMARPAQIPALLRIASDAYAAQSALKRLRRILGPGFGLPGLSRPEHGVIAPPYAFHQHGLRSEAAHADDGALSGSI